jgi:hypothetical protein
VDGLTLTSPDMMDANPPPLFAAMVVVGIVGFFIEVLAFSSAKKSSAFDFGLGFCSLALASTLSFSSCTRSMELQREK